MSDFHDLSEMFEKSQVDVVRPDRTDPEVVRRRKRTRRRGLIGLAVVLVVVGAAVGTYLPLTLLAPVDDTIGTLRQPTVEPQSAPVFPVPRAFATAVSVTGVEAEFPAITGTDGVLNATGGNEARPIASISKVITSLVILDAKPLAPGEAGPTLTFSKADNDLYDRYYVLGATIAPMKIGSTMTQHDALAMMLMVSASNYAEATANWALGSPGAVRAATTAWLSAHGLSGTTIVEPTGIDPRNTSTPTDLIAIARLAMANSVVAEIVGLPAITIPGLGLQQNRNSALGAEGINGIKTGTLEEAGSCLLFASTIKIPGLDPPLTIIGVVLGAGDSYMAGITAQEMIAGVRSGFHHVRVAASGESIGDYVTAWDDTARVVIGDSATLIAWGDMPITATASIRPLGDTANGAEIGSATFTAGARTVTVPLQLGGALNGPGGKWRLLHPQQLLVR